MTRFQAKHSEVLKVTVPEGAGLVAAALRSPAGQLTVYLLNLENSDRAVNLRLHGVAPDHEWFQYQVDEKALAEPGFRLAPTPLVVRTLAGTPTAQLSLLARSLTALGTYRLAADALGVFAEERAYQPGR